MVKKRLIESLISQDAETKRWKMRFASARMAYEDGKLPEAERLLMRLQEPAAQLTEHVFAINTVRIGLAAVQIAQSRLEEAKANLQRAIAALEGSRTAAEKELLAVGLRFLGQLLIESNDRTAAERELERSVSILKELGTGAAVQLAYSLSDLAGLYVMQGRLEEANQLILDAMQLLVLTVGPEDKEYARADLIHNLCKASNEDLLEIAEACGIRLQYQFGAQHPTMVRALRRYIKALKEHGDLARLEQAKQTFSAFDKAAEAPRRAG